MTEPDLPPPPEAALIGIARKARGMSAADAVRRMAETCPPEAVISVGYWRDIERGYGGRRSQRVPVRASATTLAHQAAVVGVDADRLEKAGRPDAAGVLREIMSQARSGQPADELAELRELRQTLGRLQRELQEAIDRLDARDEQGGAR